MKTITAVAKRTSAVLAALAIALPGAVYATDADTPTEIYVAPNGSDEAAGTKDAPLATIAAARDAVRASGAEGATVYIGAGIYPQTEPLQLDERDSGVTFKAYDGEAVIEGGVVLDPEIFRPLSDTDAMADRIIDEQAKGKIIVADLDAAGVDYSDGIFTSSNPGFALYYGGTRANIARFPNYRDGYIYGFHSFVRAGDPVDCEADINNNRFYDKRGRIASWADLDGAYIAGSFSIDWQQTYPVPITAYDSETGMVTIKSGALSDQSGYSGRYYYLNVPEELDETGEYYVDRETGTLYFYAPDGWQDMRLTVGAVREAVVYAKADNLTFEGITIEGGYDDGIIIIGDGNRMIDCTVRDCGDIGIKAEGLEFVFDSGEVAHIGNTAINLKGGDRVSLAPSHSSVTNSRIHNFGDVGRVYEGAMYVEGSGFYIAHNEIYDAPHTTFTEGATCYTYEYNYIHDVCYESGDAGAIYVGGWVSNGSVFRYNVIKDVVCDQSIYYNPHGIYSDAGGGMRNIYSNIFINIDGSGVYCGGRDIRVLDNIFVNTSIHFDQCGYYPFTGVNAGYTQIAEFPVDPNALGPTGYNWKLPVLNTKLSGYGTEIWSIFAPKLAIIKTTNVVDLEDNFVPHAYGDSRIRNNVFCTARSPEISNNITRLAVIRDNADLALDSIAFADFNGGDYTLTENSKVFQAIPGFHAMDFSKVGPQE